MILKKSLTFDFGVVDQENDDKHLQFGELIEATNVRRVKGKRFEKRLGFDRTQPTFTGASWTSPAESLLPGDGQCLLARDAADRCWAYDPDANTFRDRGQLTRVLPRYKTVLPSPVGSAIPATIVAGANIWTFSASSDVSGGSSHYSYTVHDATTGIMVQAPTLVVGLAQGAGALAYDGTYVWFFFNNNVDLMAHKFVAATPATARVATTYHSFAAGDTITQIAALYLSAVGKVAVVVTAFQVGANATIYHSYLDPATGQASGAPAGVTATAAVAGQVYCNTGLSILVSDGSGNAWYYARWQFTGGGAATSSLFLTAVNATTLAVTSTVTLATSADTVATFGVGYTCGYVADNGDRVVFAQYDNLALSGALRPDLYNIVRYTRAGATTTATVARGAWIASQPVKYGGVWYFLTGYDDVPVAPVTIGGLQRTLFLRDSNGNIICPIASELAAAAYYRDRYDDLTSIAGVQQVPYIPALTVVGTKLVCGIAVAAANTPSGIDAARLELEMAQGFGSPVALGNKAVAPGGVPVVWGKDTNLHELVPMLFPSYIARTAGAAATETALAALYRFVDPDGTVYRSSPVIVAQACGAGDTFEIPTLRHTLANTLVEIEVYVGNSSALFLQGRVANNQAVDTVAFGLVAVQVGEALYTQGGALSAGPVPPSIAAGVWRNRLFLASDLYLWYSQEFEQGLGPRFNEVLRTSWPDGAGEILQIGAVDWNYFAMLKGNRVAVISGPGPDGRGAGNYITQTLKDERGTGRPVANGPGGLYFRDAATERLCCLTPALQIVEVPGAEDYKGEDVATMYQVAPEQHMRFHTSARILVLDYRHPTEAKPLGQIYNWTGDAIEAAHGACVDDTGPVWITLGGALRREGTGYVDTDNTGAADFAEVVETGELQPNGIMGQFALARMQFLGLNANLNGLHGDIKASLYKNFAQSSPTVRQVGASDSDFIDWRPAGFGRIHSVRARIEEMISLNPRNLVDNPGGFGFEQLGMEYQDRKRLAVLETTADSAFTNTSVYPGANGDLVSCDGRAYRYLASESFALITRDTGNLGGPATNPAGDNIFAPQYLGGGLYNAYGRAFYVLPISIVPLDHIVEAVWFELYGAFFVDNEYQNPDITMVSCTTVSNTDIRAADYQSAGLVPLSNKILAGNFSVGHPANWNDAGYNRFDLNAAGLAYYEASRASGLLTLCARNYNYDIAGVDFGTVALPASIGAIFAYAGPADKRPRLTIRHRAP